MMTSQPVGAHPVERLTEQALEAARRGDWDRVEACYADREDRVRNSHLDAETIARVTQVDAQIRDAVQLAQAGLSALLADAAQVKHQLRRLRESQSAALSGYENLNRQA